MELIKHMCGCELERASGSLGAYYQLVGADGAARYVEVQECPQCGGALCDSDCTDMGGVPLHIPNQTEWSKERRRARGWAA